MVDWRYLIAGIVWVAVLVTAALLVAANAAWIDSLVV